MSSVLTPEALAAYKSRQEGTSVNGTVFLRDFDEGVYLTLGATVAASGEFYEIPLTSSLDPVPGSGGVAVVYGRPEDDILKERDPYVLISRDDETPAMHRWHSSGAEQWRAPVKTAQQFAATDAQGNLQTGFSHIAVMPQAIPYDISYSLRVIERRRGPKGNKSSLLALQNHIMRRLPPYASFYVYDSVKDLRSYDAFVESTSQADEIRGVSDRRVAFSMQFRVEAELDTKDPLVVRTVERRVFTYHQKDR